MADAPSLVLDEPTATGWLRTELYGDRAAARVHVRAARRLLGQLRTMHGVNARLAEHLPGGFYSARRVLPDGSVIEAITNDGLDTLRITAAAPQPALAAVPVTRPDQPQPYLWVGIRIRWAGATTNAAGDRGVPWYGLMTSLAEPPVDGVPQGLLWPTSNAGWSLDSQADLAADTPVLTTQSVNPATGVTTWATGADAAQLVANFHAMWDGGGFHTFAPGWHNFAFYDTGDACFYSRNGLRCHDFMWCYADTPADQSLAPHDPLLADDDQVGERDFNGADAVIAAAGYATRAWDVVYVLDPQERGAPPTDRRPQIAALMRALGSAGIAPRALSGPYLLHVGAYGRSRLLSSRQNQPVATLDPNDWWRTSEADFADYRSATSLEPMVAEVEVRLGKDPHTQTYRFTLPLPGYDDATRTTYPFGEDLNGTPVCEGDAGPNTMANWYPQAIAIDVWAQTAVLSDARPDGVFAPGVDFSPAAAADYRYPVEIYLHGDYGVSQVSDADYPDFAATAVARLLDEMTTGYWGPDCEITERLYADIRAAAERDGLRKGSVWLYDNQANRFTALPVISSVGDYVYGGTSSYQQHLYWFYPYRITARQRCSKVYAILLGATSAATVVDNGNNNMSDEPAGTYDTPACCPENFV